MIAMFWNNWIVVTFIAPMLWAAVNLIDIYFVDGVYDDEFDGAIISAAFQIAPWFMVPFIGFAVPEGKAAAVAIAGGLCYTAMTFFYFKALFAAKDAAATELLLNLCILTVPLIAFFSIGERLSSSQYIGIAVSFVGTTVLSFDEKSGGNVFLRFLLITLCAVIFLSLSMVLEDIAYKSMAFWPGFLLFSFGSFIGGIFFWLVRLTRDGGGRTGVFKLSRKYFVVFLIAETLAVCGVFFLQRAIDLSPSVSFVTVIGSFQPAFILVFSAFTVAVYSIIGRKENDTIHRIYLEQLRGVKVKTVAIVIMAVGVYMIA